MSKRFGRKQKRKMLQTIEGLSNDIQIKDYSINKLQYIAAKAVDWDQEIVRLLGKHSALRLDTSRIINRDLPHNMRVSGVMDLPDYTMSAAFMPEMNMTISSYNLQKIFTEIKQDPTSFRNIIRLIATDKTKGKCVSAMYVDEQYMTRSGLTDRDIGWIAEDIAKQLAYNMNKEYGHDA